MDRYKQLIDIVEELQPQRILEVGTWNGHRAVQMLEVAPLAYYYGFDLFDMATPETDKLEFNVKGHHSKERVKYYMQQYFPGQFELHMGNSRETLKHFQNDFLDFAFIDGGHSKETIKSDIDNVVRLIDGEGTIVLDDYYQDVERLDVGVDGDILLCLHERGGTVELLPQRDKVAGGGTVQLVKVTFNGTAT